jgi:hypothetical protein
MHPPWYRAMTGCLQMIVDSADDIEVDAGEVQVGQVRERAFAELTQALDDAHKLSFAWLALADLACWPQLPAPTSASLVQALQARMPPQPARHGREPAIVAEATRTALSLAELINQAAKRMVAPNTTPPVNLAPIRDGVNGLARASHDPVEYWRRWLRRVVPAAATLDPTATKPLALAALRSTLALPARWRYGATLQGPDPSAKKVGVNVVSAGAKSSVLVKLGTFAAIDPVDRKINAKFTPEVPIDPYRMGYLFHSVCMAELLDDSLSGYYDTATCTNTATREVWSYSAL